MSAQCRHCGTEIADKALICFKCGTATTDAKYQPAAPPRASMPARVDAIVVALALLVATALYAGWMPRGGRPGVFTWGIVAVAVALVGWRVYARRR